MHTFLLLSPSFIPNYATSPLNLFLPLLSTPIASWIYHFFMSQCWKHEGQETKDRNAKCIYVDEASCAYAMYALCAIEWAPTSGDPMNEWSPQCLVLNSHAWFLQTRAYDFFYEVNQSPDWSFFSCCLIFSQRYFLFQRTLPSHDLPEVGQL